MDVSQETQEKIAQLQLLEQNLHSFATQKRTMQSQMLEIDNALKEAETATGAIYKIVGSVMFQTEKEKLNKDLKERKEVLDLRIKSIEKQEKGTEEKAKKLQTEVMAELEKHMEKDERTH